MLLVKSLNYRTPADDARDNRLLLRLRQREAGFWLRVFTKLAIGLPLTLLAPLVVASFLSNILWRFGVAVEWGLLFFLSLIILIPLFFFIEWRTRGEFLAEEMRAQGTTPSELFNATSRGELQLRRSAAAAAGLIEIFLFAPRLILGAVVDIRQRIKLNDASMRRAAQILALLQSHQGGVEITVIRHPDESPLDVFKVTGYLRLLA